MEKSKIRKRNSIFIFVSIICLILFNVYIYPAPNSGSEIVYWARSYLGAGYKLGQPPNKWDDYGSVFDWTNWNGKFDCSGLVSYATGLRRRYITSELKDSYLNSVSAWSSLQEGDILHTNGVSGTGWPSAHVMIFVERKTVDGVIRIRVIHASSGKDKVVEIGDDELGFNEDTLKSAGFSPYYFKSDSIDPTITVYGIENNKTYNTSRTVSFSVSDNVTGSDFYAYAEQSGTKFNSRTFSTDGNYTVRFFANDWALNITDF